MDQSIVLWILGSMVLVLTGVIGYILKEQKDIRNRIHTRNNDLGALLTEIQVDAKGVSEMVNAHDKAQTEIKKTVEEIRKTAERFSNELSRLAGHLGIIDKR